ncbi:hypothetical protein [Nocardia suismassiliense]|uniref:hypothetical protein n=1 Tax=Nocardia suismassiliense TaxID=2077092 RepID=UPI00131F3F90|nr:hypothetical protein [Nocardia suismassiliense]
MTSELTPTQHAEFDQTMAVLAVFLPVALLIALAWAAYRVADRYGWGWRTWLVAGDPVRRERERRAAHIRRTWPALARKNRMSRPDTTVTQTSLLLGELAWAFRRRQTPPIDTRVDAEGIDIDLYKLPGRNGVGRADLVSETKLAACADELTRTWQGQLSWTRTPDGWHARLTPDPAKPFARIPVDMSSERYWLG